MGVGIFGCGVGFRLRCRAVGGLGRVVIESRRGRGVVWYKVKLVFICFFYVLKEDFLYF